jgi:outer membrane lipase/esterase
MSLRQTLLFSAIFFCLLLSPIAAHAANPQFSALYVFGDSYNDVGNIYIASVGTVPGPPYYKGRFSNGPLWIEHIAYTWGLGQIAPSLAGGTDYAFGGAEVTADVPVGGGNVIPSVPHQVAAYLLASKGKADPNALYVLEGGGDDILNATGGSPQQLAYQIAAGLAGAELALRLAGARNFLIPTVYDLSLSPAGSLNPAFTKAASLATNKFLDEFLTLEMLFPGNHITRLNSFDLFNGIIVNDPYHYAFTDVVHPCVNQITHTPCADPAHTFFWDGIHPTTFGHAFLAVTVEALFAH